MVVDRNVGRMIAFRRRFLQCGMIQLESTRCNRSAHQWMRLHRFAFDRLHAVSDRAPDGLLD